MPKNVKNWIEKHPLFSKLFRFILPQPDPAKVIEEPRATRTKTAPQAPVLAIYESELQAIGLESTSWEVETGGDLFGIWEDIPIIYLATKPGPKAVRENAHFGLDIDYLIKISNELSNEWGMRYFGDWHSHHKLGLDSPSSGDTNRIKRLARKNNFADMAEFIISFVNDSKKDRIIRVNPFTYQDFPEANPIAACIIVLKGLSPIREVLIKRNLMPEQHLESYSRFKINRVKIPIETPGRTMVNEGKPQRAISKSLLLNAGKKLNHILSKDIEVHQEPFGNIFVIPVQNEQYVAFAIDGKWPHRILQVDWIDRKVGQSTEVGIKNDDLSLLNLDGIINCYYTIRESKNCH